MYVHCSFMSQLWIFFYNQENSVNSYHIGIIYEVMAKENEGLLIFVVSMPVTLLNS